MITAPREARVLGAWTSSDQGLAKGLFIPNARLPVPRVGALKARDGENLVDILDFRYTGVCFIIDRVAESRVFRWTDFGDLVPCRVMATPCE